MSEAHIPRSVREGWTCPICLARLSRGDGLHYDERTIRSLGHYLDCGGKPVLSDALAEVDL